MVRFMISRRGYATIPPFIASLKGSTAVTAKTAESSSSISSLVSFYKRLPKGKPSSAELHGTGVMGAYRARYAGSGAPLLHFALAVFGVGYFVSYHCHLKHHKNVEFH